jgi:DNA-directed RNA polymerase specialized sigma24 family protein
MTLDRVLDWVDRPAGRAIVCSPAGARSAVSAAEEAHARALIHRVYPMVIRVVRWFQQPGTKDQQLARQVCVQILNALGGAFDRDPPQAWVSRVAIRVCLRELAAERVSPRLVSSELTAAERQLALRLISVPGGWEHGANADGAARTLTGKLLRCLRPRARLLVRLLDVETQELEAVQRLTGWPRWLVRWRASRARRELRRCLRQVPSVQTA